VAKAVLALLIALAPAFAGAQRLDTLSRDSNANQSAAFHGGALTCSQPEVLRVPPNIVQRAKLELRLMDLLRASVIDDARGIVNIAREKEIRKLANKLRKDSE
jgi:hypothetical protein